MSTKFMNSEKSKTSDAHKLRLNLTDKTDLRRRNNRVVLPNLSFYYTWKETKKSHKNSKFKISGTIWDQSFQLSDGSYSISTTKTYK